MFPGEVYAIIGANGAGKSTLLRTIAGLHQPTDGSILYDGNNLTRVRPERRATQGIAMVPEGLLPTPIPFPVMRDHPKLGPIGKRGVFPTSVPS